jgi:acyl carrier protein
MEEKVLEIMSKTFNIDVLLLSKKTSKKDLSQWDSMSHLNLIIDIENEFNINFSNEEIVTIIDFKSLLKIIKNKI